MNKHQFIGHFIAANWFQWKTTEKLVEEAKKAWAVYDTFLRNG